MGYISGIPGGPLPLESPTCANHEALSPGRNCEPAASLRTMGVGFRVLGCRVLGFWVWGLGFRFWVEAFAPP